MVHGHVLLSAHPCMPRERFTLLVCVCMHACVAQAQTHIQKHILERERETERQRETERERERKNPPIRAYPPIRTYRREQKRTMRTDSDSAER